MSDSKRLNSLLSLSAIAALVATVLFVELPANTRLWRELQNSGHALLFGAIAIAILVVTRNLIGTRPTGNLAPYLTALGMTVLIGAATELAQMFSSRDADLYDLLLDAAGAIAFLGLYSTFDKRLSAIWKGGKDRVKAMIRIGCASLLLAAFVSPAVWAVAQTYRNAVSPVICSYDSLWGRMYISTNEADLDYVSPPTGWAGNHNNDVARLTFKPADYPEILIEEPFPDWSEFEYFHFAVFNELDSSVTLTLRIDDYHHNGNYEDRFNEQIVVKQGENLYRIPLTKIRTAPLNREMDMRHIASIRLFAYRPRDPFTVFLDDFHLE